MALGAAALLIALAAPQASAGWLKWKRPKKMTRPERLIFRQSGAEVDRRLDARINPANSYVIISLSKQRAYLKVGDETYIDTPVSTGKRAGTTPTGTFSITEKDADHRSSIYGDYVDSRGRVVRSGISTKVDSAPSGTRYVGAPMRYFCRLTSSGVGMHVGILPGYPASHGCIRLPAEIAPLIYEKVRLGTKVTIVR